MQTLDTQSQPAYRPFDARAKSRVPRMGKCRGTKRHFGAVAPKVSFADNRFPAGPSFNRRASLGTAEPTECDRSDPEKGCYQIVAEKVFVMRETLAKPRKAVCAAKGCKAPLPISLIRQFLLQNAVRPFANGLRYQHELRQSAAVHLRNQHVRKQIY